MLCYLTDRYCWTADGGLENLTGCSGAGRELHLPKLIAVNLPLEFHFP